MHLQKPPGSHWCSFRARTHCLSYYIHFHKGIPTQLKQNKPPTSHTETNSLKELFSRFSNFLFTLQKPNKQTNKQNDLLEYCTGRFCHFFLFQELMVIRLLLSEKEGSTHSLQMVLSSLVGWYSVQCRKSKKK